MRLIVFAVLGLAACGGGRPLPPMTCPAVAASRGTLYDEPSVLALGEERSGKLQSGRFGAHALGVPLTGNVTLHVTLKLASGGQIPVLFVYGPREPNGEYGTCAAAGGQAGESTDAALDVAVPAGKGGEYLLLVATNPLGRASSEYDVKVICEGANCAAKTCPPLAGQQCEDEICPSGFNTGPDGCPTCGCHQTQCGPFQKRVFDTCVCLCPDGPSAPVCGADGKTYKSACDAQCKEVALVKGGACNCELLSCDKQCEFGLKLEKGCPKCECADACQGASAAYAPVCGTDGLTHTNADRARCAGHEVAYLGPCLPYCELPVGCNLTCPFGLRPLPGLGKGCFECGCIADIPNFAGQVCAGDSSAWCAEWGGAIDAKGSEWTQGLIDAVMDLGFPRLRTFPNACAAMAAGWKPVVAAACPSFACTRNDDCKEAAEVLGIPTGGPGPGPGLGKIGCMLGGKKKSPIGVCRVALPLAECTDDASCPKEQTCELTPEGKRCKSPCECLNSFASKVYEPVCADGEDFFNPCFALCAGKWPADHPGRCCDKGERLTVAQLSIAWTELGGFCAASEPPQVPAFSLSQTCPRPPDECDEGSEDEGACCRPPAQ